MNRVVAFQLLGSLLAFHVAGCQSAPQQGKDKIYEITGKVVALDTQKKTVTLDHEDIPGFMKAMEMEFKVESAAVLDGLKANDRVHGKLKVGGGESVVTILHKK